MYCQVCGARNGDDAEYCHRCRSLLLILSGPDQGDDFFGSVPIEEHLLERISALEDKVLRMEEALYAMLQSLRSQDQSLLAGQAGLQAIRDILEEKGVLEGDSFLKVWEDRLNTQVLSRERAEKVEDRLEQIKTAFGGQSEDEFVQYLLDAVKAFDASDDLRGFKHLGAASKLDRKNVELLSLIGELHTLSGNYREARVYLERARKLDPRNFQVNFNLALGRFYDGDLAGAQSNLEICLQNNLNPFLVHFTLGMLHFHEGNYPEAEIYLSIAYEARRHPQVSMMLGTVLYELGKARDAIRVLKDTVEEDPGNEEARFLLGLCYLDRNWTQKAAQEFRRALKANPGRMEIQQALLMSRVWKELAGIPETTQAGRLCHQADELLASGKVKQALRLFRKAIESDPENHSIAVGYVVAALQARQYPLVLSLCQRLLRMDLPEVLSAPLYAALLYALRGLERHHDGVRFAREMERHTHVPYARTIANMELAYHLAQLGRELDEAYLRAREALKGAPDELVGECYDTLGWVSFKMGKLEEAHKNLKRSVKVQANPHNLLHLGMVCLQMGRRDEARQSFQNARKSKDRATDVHRVLWDHLKNGLRRKER
ncbi:MAG TPA: tetratricopeptide repeat protein [Thermoanaerobaculia bacterium]|nr:tetratricopeptide repeat protein [Thermoanaerobaculia bacterium]HUM30900.1 tetratricopeptide repeat protein [Thermoanaerobaculia bacterium]HXK69210.1 tetratricopeptide repeat protein [Thermoanaerobaculia bacterium]